MWSSGTAHYHLSSVSSVKSEVWWEVDHSAWGEFSNKFGSICLTHLVWVCNDSVTNRSCEVHLLLKTFAVMIHVLSYDTWHYLILLMTVLQNQQILSNYPAEKREPSRKESRWAQKNQARRNISECLGKGAATHGIGLQCSRAVKMVVQALAWSWAQQSSSSTWLRWLRFGGACLPLFVIVPGWGVEDARCGSPPAILP